MKHRAPIWAADFACAAGRCPDSCCRAGWEIIPDRETLELYAALPGSEGDRIRQGISPGPEPLLRQDEARVCVLLDPDGLCCVQRCFGHEALCRVCREYPRFHREFGALTEHGLSLSCPTAFALALSRPPAFQEWEDEAPPALNELDPMEYRRFLKGRELALGLLAREELPLPARLRLLRRLATAMQSAPEKQLKHDYALRLRRWSTCPVKTNSQFTFLNSQFSSLARRFLDLEILSPEWKDALERFAALAETGQLPPDLLTLETPEDPDRYARWLWHSLYKYWMDALDDGKLLARVDRSLAMLLLALAMDRALPGTESHLRRLSREIEHCEENLAALLTAPGIVL